MTVERRDYGTVGKYPGALVRLVRDVTTMGGETFRAGCVMRCEDATAYGLSLRCYVRGWYRGVRNVSKDAVEVLEWPMSPSEQADYEFALDLEQGEAP